MTSVSTEYIGGISSYIQDLDHTSGPVYDTYIMNIQSIESILNSPGAMTSTQSTQLTTAINKLKNLLAQGALDPDSGRTSYVTRDMGERLGAFFNSLQGVGIDVTSNSNAIQFPSPGDADTILATLNSWKTAVMGTGTLSSLFTYADTTTNHSLQGLVELNYVKTGNEILSTQLSGLESALNLTDGVLNTLTNLQVLHNDIQTNAKNGFPFDYAGQVGLSDADYTAGYIRNASSYFGTPIVPVADPSVLYGTQKVNQAELDYLQAIKDGGRESTINFYATQNSILPLFENPASNDLGMPIYLTDEVAAYYGIDKTNRVNFDGTPNPNGINYAFDLNNPLNAKLLTDLNSLQGPTTYYEAANLGSGIPILPEMKSSYDFLTDQAIACDANNAPFYTFVNYQGSLQPAIQQFGTSPTLTQDVADRYGLSLPPINSNGVNYILFKAGSTQATLDVYLNDIEAAKTLESLRPTLALISKSYYAFQLLPTMSLSAAQKDAFVTFCNSSDILKANPSSGGHYLYTAGLSYTSATKTFTLTHDTVYVTALVAQWNQYRDQLASEISQLQAVAAGTGAASDQNSLLSRLQGVKSDLDTVSSQYDSTHQINSFITWLVDKYDLRGSATANQSGNYQQNLTYAITASQSLNDTQKEKVRNFLYVFEEYYKSASAILQQLTQILQRMAQNMGR